MNAGSPVISQISVSIREHTQGRNPMSVIIVEKPSVATQASKYIKEGI